MFWHFYLTNKGTSHEDDVSLEDVYFRMTVIFCPIKDEVFQSQKTLLDLANRLAAY